MIDSVLKGTGNSRFLKSAVPSGTSWADALAMLQAGTFPIDFNGINTEGFQQVGTPLNKANLLKDATAAQIGLPPSTTPDGMFQALGNTGELHVWRKTVTLSEGIPAVQAGYTLGSTTSIDIFKNARPTTSFKCYWKVADSVSVDNDGNVALVSPDEISIYYNQGDTLASSFRGKFAQYSRTESGGLLNDKNIYWIPQGASIGFLNDSGIYRVYMSAQLVSGHPYTPEIPAGTTTTYPVSTNPNVYQEGSDAKPAGYVLGDVVNTTLVIAYRQNTVCNFSYSDALYVADDGSISLSNPTSGTAGGSYNGAPTYLSGKFLKFVSISGNGGTTLKEGVIYYIPSNATIKIGSYAGYVDAEIDRYQPVTGYAAIPASTTIEYLGKLGDKARVQVVSYVGTGTYGESNPNSLTFDFVPKLLFVMMNATTKTSVGAYPYANGWENMFIWAYGVAKTCVSRYDLTFTQNGKTISWYSSTSDDRQCNWSGVKYTAVAIG